MGQSFPTDPIILVPLENFLFTKVWKDKTKEQKLRLKLKYCNPSRIELGYIDKVILLNKWCWKHGWGRLIDPVAKYSAKRCPDGWLMDPVL